MVNEILNFISYNFGQTAWLAVFIVAMIPIAEAKVAIPFGLAVGVWGNMALSPSVAALVAFVGSTIPAIFIILFLKPVFAVLKKTKLFKKLIESLEKLFKKRGEREVSVAYMKEQRSRRKQEKRVKKILKMNVLRLEKEHADELIKIAMSSDSSLKDKTKEISKIKQAITLMFFVALPLPLAGVWMSSAIAAFNDMKFWPSFFAIAFGNLIEVLFVTVICVLFVDSIGIVLIMSLILIVGYITIMYFVNRRKDKIIKEATKKIQTL